MTVQDGNPSDEMVKWVKAHLKASVYFDTEIELPSRQEAIKRIAYYFEMNDFSVEEMERLYNSPSTTSSADVLLLFDFCRVSHDTYEEVK